MKLHTFVVIEMSSNPNEDEPSVIQHCKTIDNANRILFRMRDSNPDRQFFVLIVPKAV